MLTWVVKTLYHKAADCHKKLYPDKPYLQHLEMLIKYRMVPFASVDALFEHRIDARVVRQIYLFTAIIFLNLFRLSIIAIDSSSAIVREYFVHYFSGQANSWYFHLSMLGTFIVPSVLCIYLEFNL